MRLKKLLLALVLVLGSASLVRAGDTYTIDDSHSSIGFSVKHLLISNVKGDFTQYKGDINFDPKDPTKSSVSVTIQAASIDTRSEKRDAHLRNEDFFETSKYPEIKFVSKKIVKKANDYELIGDLTMKDVTKEVAIPFTLTGPIDDPWGNVRLAAAGTLTINRQDYNIDYDPTGATVGNEVKISLDIEAVKAKAAAPKKK